MQRGVCLVTGGGRGIGAATVRLAAQSGYQVAFFYRADAAAAEQCARETGATAIQADVGDEQAVVRGFQAADRLGRLEVLVNNAAITGPVSRLVDLRAHDLERLCQVNIQGAFIAAREAIRRMSRLSGGQGGSIVNVSSGASRSGSPGVWIHYAATKGAIDTMTIGLAKEVGPEGIRVNAVRPGITRTDIHDGRPPGQLEQMAKAVPLGRIGEAGEIARAILWLASEEASYVTGALVDAGGGL